MFDARKGSNSDAIFQLEAHKENTTVLSFSPLNTDLFMTGSEDGKVTKSLKFCSLYYVKIGQDLGYE